jgi:hypothetical protein
MRWNNRVTATGVSAAVGLVGALAAMSSPAVAHVATSQHTAIPAYWGPDTATGAAMFQRLAQNYPTNKIVVINGSQSKPQTPFNQSWANAIKKVHDAGSLALMYVDTGYYGFTFPPATALAGSTSTEAVVFQASSPDSYSATLTVNQSATGCGLSWRSACGEVRCCQVRWVSRCWSQFTAPCPRWSLASMIGSSPGGAGESPPLSRNPACAARMASMVAGSSSAVPTWLRRMGSGSIRSAAALDKTMTRSTTGAPSRAWGQSTNRTRRGVSRILCG